MNLSMVKLVCKIKMEMQLLLMISKTPLRLSLVAFEEIRIGLQAPEYISRNNTIIF